MSSVRSRFRNIKLVIVFEQLFNEIKFGANCGGPEVQKGVSVGITEWMTYATERTKREVRILADWAEFNRKVSISKEAEST